MILPSLAKWIPKISPQLQEPEHLAPLIELIESIPDELVEVCLSVPPRHGKTTLIVHAIAWLMLKHPWLKILYVSYAHDFAVKQVRAARRLLKKSGAAFGEVVRNDYFEVRANDDLVGSVKAAGIAGQLTGEGFHLVIIDDPHKNRAEAESKPIRDRVITAFRDDIYTRQQPEHPCSFLIVHTRWHPEDMIGQLTTQGDEDARPFQLINLPAIRLVASNGRMIERALAPKIWTLDRLVRLRSRVGPYAWASLYMGQPQPRGGRAFGDVTLFDRSEIRGLAMRYSIGVDLAHTAKKRSDHHALVVMGKPFGSELIYVISVVRMQGSLVDQTSDGVFVEGFAREIARVQREYGGAVARQYTGRDEELVLQMLAQLKGHHAIVEGVRAASDKFMRAQPYAAAYNSGRVRVMKDQEWTSEFVKEHSAFSGLAGGRDDQVDAACPAFDILSGTSGAAHSPPRKEPEKRPRRLRELFT